jgi:hypothetical protein
MIPQCRKERTCRLCKQSFVSPYKKTVYCSVLCSGRHRAQLRSERARKNWVRSCQRCGKSFSNRNKAAKYCSKQCGFGAITKYGSINCAGCHQLFKPSYEGRKFCSMKCRDLHKNETRSCDFCGGEFTVNKCVIRRGRLAGRFCSAKCYSDFAAGSANPNWRGGGSYTRGADWVQIRRSIRKRDNYTCQRCGKPEKSRRHDVHHKIPWRISQDNSPENLITLCMNCHRTVEPTPKVVSNLRSTPTASM